MGRALPIIGYQEPSRRWGSKRPESLDDIVTAYQLDHAPGATVELTYFKGLGLIREVLLQAGLARIGARKLRHQFRIPNRVLRRSANALVANARAIERCRSFDDLIRLVEKIIGQLSGIGKLTVYDTAVRVGGFLGYEPDKVFLHAGTKGGAEALGFDGKRTYLVLEELPRAFQRLTPREIEDCLCIYKHHLRRLGRSWRDR